jgi:hypothetical protein
MGRLKADMTGRIMTSASLIDIAARVAHIFDRRNDECSLREERL